jgi:hypothetical protein
MTDPITIQTTIKAPITKVWEYYNEPEHIIKWAFASDEWEAPYSENDLKVGGRFKTTMAARRARRPVHPQRGPHRPWPAGGGVMTALTLQAPAPEQTVAPAVRLEGVTKRFGAVLARLDGEAPLARQAHRERLGRALRGAVDGADHERAVFGNTIDREAHADRIPQTRDPLQAAGVQRVFSLDLHAPQIQGFFNIPFDNIYSSPVVLHYLQKEILFL